MQCVVTSPPYWGLRAYGTEPVVWPDGWVGELGAEPTPEMYVEHLVGIFREVKRVLRPDGTLWLNLGDAYSSGGRSWRDADSKNGARAMDYRAPTPRGLKPKDLVGIPWRVAFALQADGWYLRADIIWNKPSCMPSSVKDRPTTSHEYVFLLTKSARYYYDSHAVREKGVYPAGTRGAKGSAGRQAAPGVNARPPEYKMYDGYRNRRSVWHINPAPSGMAHFSTFPGALVKPCVLAGCPPGGTVLDPFGGTGTTAAVAHLHGRHAISIDLDPASLEQFPVRLAALKRRARAKRISSSNGQQTLPLILTVEEPS